MKNIIITGATGSVGKAAAIEAAKQKDIRIILAGRNIKKLDAVKDDILKLQPLAVIETLAVDLGDLSSVKKAAGAIAAEYQQLHALVNVAAVYQNSHTLNKEGYETMFATNHLGPFYFTTLLAPLLKNTAGSRVLTVSAPSTTKIDLGNLNGEKKFSSFSAFGASKMMNLLFAFKLANEYENSDHASIAFHPGLVKSELLSTGPKLLSAFLKLVSSSPEVTAQAIINLIMNENTKQLNGKFFTKKLKELKAAPHAYDSLLQQKLWDEGIKLTARV
jgi:NAD(P)-dependent dehydrogenase (short-subunit alcohol dehydrogenase family)